MDRFTQAYDEARRVIITKKQYATFWQNYLNRKVAPILDQSGPNSAHAAGLNDLRRTLTAVAAGKKTGSYRSNEAAIICEASSGSTADVGLAERAAALKMMKHLYWAHRSGGQSVWIYSPPKAYTKWVFEEITGNKTAIVNELKHNTGVYSANHRKVMCAALKQANRCAQLAAANLGRRNRRTRRVFQRWFGDASGNTLKSRMSSLAAMFVRLSTVMNATTMVLSDEPNDRNSGGWKDWGFVYTSRERFPVVYIQKAFLTAAGNSGLLWKCVITMVHELSHYELSTEDYRYDNGGGDLGGGKGLSPGGAFTPAKAMNNADNLAFFSVDLAGMLPRADRDRALAGTLS